MDTLRTRGHVLLGSLAVLCATALAMLLLSDVVHAARSGACYGTITYWPNPGQTSAKPTCTSSGCLPCSSTPASMDQYGNAWYVCRCPNVNPPVYCDVATPVNWLPGQPLWTCFHPVCPAPKQCHDIVSPLQGGTQTVECDCVG